MFNETTSHTQVERWDSIIGGWIFVADIEEGVSPQAIVAEDRMLFDDPYMGETANYRLVTVTKTPIQ